MTTQKAQPVAKAAMLIRKPVQDVFEAMVNPDITSQFWFSKGIGRLDKEKSVEWIWEFYDFKQQVFVDEVVPERSLAFNWAGNGITTYVTITFEPIGADTTFISMEEKGWDPEDEKLIEYISGQTEGWALVCAAMKAYLEQGVRIKVVEDRYPDPSVLKQA